MIFSWLNTRAAKDFGAELARYFATQLPLEGKNLTDKKFANRTQAAMRQMSTRIATFKTTEALNVYKRAKLCNAFKWTLRDAGYEVAYVDKLTDWLVTQL